MKGLGELLWNIIGFIIYCIVAVAIAIVATITLIEVLY